MENKEQDRKKPITIDEFRDALIREFVPPEENGTS